MPDLEELVRASMTHRDVVAPPDLLARARRTRRRRRTALASAAAAAAGVAVAVTVPLVLSAPRTSTPGTDSPPPPSTGHGTVDGSMFTVASPVLGWISTGIGVDRPPCRPSEVSGRAELRRIPGGVAGVVVERGAECSLRPPSGAVRLLDAHRHLLDVRTTGASDAGVNVHAFNAYLAGTGAWGFSWTGSWCGPAPAFVVIPIRSARDPGGPATTTVPISGPAPDCHGRPGSLIVRGVAGDIGDSVLPPPASWHGLVAQLHAPRSAPYESRLSVTIANRTAHDIALDPCPRYTVGIYYGYRDGSTQPQDNAVLCPSDPVIPAQSSRTFRLQPMSLPDDDNRHPTSMRIEFAIAAGVSADVAVRVPPGS